MQHCCILLYSGDDAIEVLVVVVLVVMVTVVMLLSLWCWCRLCCLLFCRW